MTENKFLSFILTESILLIFLGLCMLILPKVTDITFGFALCLIMIIYGGYKAIIAFLARNFERHFILNIILGVILLSSGLMLFFAPIVDMIIVVSLIGIFFVLESISAGAFALQTQGIIKCGKIAYIISAIRLFFGIFLLVFIPTLWSAGTFVGLDFIISGAALTNIYLSKKYT